MYEFDDLSIYAGDNIQITDKIFVKQPTLSEIKKFGERRYFGAVYNLCASGADLKWQLWQEGKDYTKLSDYEIFYGFTYKALSSNKYLYQAIKEYPNLLSDEIKKYVENLDEKEIEGLKQSPLELTLNIDLADFKPMTLQKNGFEQIVLYNEIEDITIDKLVFLRIVEIVRKVHFLKRNNETPANEKTKRDLIEDARDEAIASQYKHYESVLLPLISSLSVECGLCGTNQIWNMKINEFLDNTKRIGKIMTAKQLLQGAYSGFSSLKGVDKSLLDWSGSLN